MMSVLHIREYVPVALPANNFSDEDAQILLHRYKESVSVEWPTPKTGNQWSLTSQGCVGYIPLGADRGISLQPKAPLSNIFRMLEYAYDLESFKLLDPPFSCESIHDLYDRIAMILAQRVLDRARHGLHKNYVELQEDLACVRGRIDMPVLASRIIKTKLPCCYEEHTLDIPDNQIIEWTIHVILHSGICTEKTIKVLREVERRLGGTVSLVLFSGADCIGRLYSRLNADYELLHKLCRFFLDNSGPTHQIGRRSMIPFLVNMASLFELFVARWLKSRLDRKYTLKAQESLVVSKDGNLKMRMDLVLYTHDSKQPLCVLDTKYKVHESIHPADYNQAVAYADALHCDTALLIYPQELTIPFDFKKGNVRVKTIAFDVSKDLDESGKALLKQVYEITGIDSEPLLTPEN